MNHICLPNDLRQKDTNDKLHKKEKTTDIIGKS